MQSSIFAAQTGLYLPSIKCHWEIEGAEGPMKTGPNKHNVPVRICSRKSTSTFYEFYVRVLPIEIQQGKTNSLANHIC